MWILIFLSIITLEFIIGYYAFRKYQKRLSQAKELGIIFNFHKEVTRLELLVDRLINNYRGAFWIFVSIIFVLDLVLTIIIIFAQHLIHIIK